MGELETIRVFLKVAEARSFSGAARELAMTPASVTRAIAALEERLGVQLLLRTTRQVSLTSAGAVYAARVRPLVDAITEAASETMEAQGIIAGRIRVSAPLSLGMRVLPQVLSQFALLYPQTRIELTLSDRFVDIVEDAFDLAIRISGPPADKSTIWRKICPVARVLVASPGYLDRHGRPDRPEELVGHACLSYSPDGGVETWELISGALRRSVRAEGGFGANNGDLLARLALHGEGIALLPRFIVEEDLRAGRLTELLPGWSAPAIWLTLYYPPYEKLPLRVATFSDFFERHVRETRPL